MKTQISFDGEYFEMHIPTVEELLAFRKFLEEKVIDVRLRWMHIRNDTLSYEEDVQLGVHRFYSGNSHVGTYSISSGFIEATPIFNVCLQPYLTPLDRQFLQEELSEKDFPDGTLTRGGTLVLNKKPFFEYPIPINPGEIVKIGDSDEQTMECYHLDYMVFQKKLWLIQPMLTAPIELILKMYNWSEVML